MEYLLGSIMGTVRDAHRTPVSMACGGDQGGCPWHHELAKVHGPSAYGVQGGSDGGGGHLKNHLPNSKSYWRLWVIGIVEVIWKIVVTVLNCHIGMSITCYSVLHTFCSIIWTGTTSLDANLLQHLVDINKEVLCNILLNLHNYYNDLDRDRWCDVLTSYGVGPREIWLLRW